MGEKAGRKPGPVLAPGSHTDARLHSQRKWNWRQVGVDSGSPIHVSSDAVEKASPKQGAANQINTF